MSTECVGFRHFINKHPEYLSYVALTIITTLQKYVAITAQKVNIIIEPLVSAQESCCSEAYISGYHL